jgi:hypothetical protein
MFSLFGEHFESHQEEQEKNENDLHRTGAQHLGVHAEVTREGTDKGIPTGEIVATQERIDE